MTATGTRPALPPDGRPVAPIDAAVEVAAEEPDTLEASEALPRLVKIAGEVVAPATLLTALLFQFGRLHSAGYFRHFGVNFTVLDLTTTDFLIVGADGLFIPLAAACVLALVLVWGHRLVVARLSAGSRRRALRAVAPLAGVLGAALVALALLDLLTDVQLF
jgi:hypothetical protein